MPPLPWTLRAKGFITLIATGMESQVVTARGWLNSREFLKLFAISRAALGPGVMLATLVGWKLAGWNGAVIASLALFVASSLLCSNVHRDKRWHRAMREGLAPVGTGLIIAGVISIFGLMGTWLAAAIAIAARSTQLFSARADACYHLLGRARIAGTLQRLKCLGYTAAFLVIWP